MGGPTPGVTTVFEVDQIVDYGEPADVVVLHVHVPRYCALDPQTGKIYYKVGQIYTATVIAEYGVNPIPGVPPTPPPQPY